MRRGAPGTFLIADLPFGTYHTGVQDAMRAAVKLIQETGADAVKLEGASPEVLEVITIMTRNGIPVMGHVGLTPQTEVSLGGRKVQGRDEQGAQRILEEAQAVEQAGAFAIVLEVIPARLSRLITERLEIPTHRHRRGAVLQWSGLGIPRRSGIIGRREEDRPPLRRTRPAGHRSAAGLRRGRAGRWLSDQGEQFYHQRPRC